MLKIDAGAIVVPPAQAAQTAARIEKAGYDAMWMTEGRHDPFVGLAVAASLTDRIELQTTVAVAFARSPMTMAVAANDVHSVSRGRLTLGLACGVEEHITSRYSMPWSRPAARIREYVLALRAIWDTWQTGSNLDFRGDFYTHTRLPPIFNPGPNEFGHPRVYLCGVGRRMAEVAGEVADGFLCHNFMTERYLREVIVPALRRGRAKNGATMDGFELGAPAFLATGEDPDQLEAAAKAIKWQIAFYAGNTSYRTVLELHGWEGLAVDVGRLAERDRWEQLADVVDDEMLYAFAVVAEPGRLPHLLLDRYGDVITRVAVALPAAGSPDPWPGVAAGLRTAADEV